MAQTFSGTTTPYATNQDMINRYDVRTLGDLLSDNNNRLDPATVLASAMLTTLLLGASGYLELATYAGMRYSLADLQALPNPSGQREVLVDIVCARCFQVLRGRRPHIVVNPGASYGESLDLLNKLRQGERIFGFIESATAGMNVSRLMDYGLINEQAARWLGCSCTWGWPGQAGSGDWCGGYGHGCC